MDRLGRAQTAPPRQCSPVGHGEGPGTGGTVQRVPDLGLLAVGARLHGEQAGGGALEVQYGGFYCREEHGQRKTHHKMIHTTTQMMQWQKKITTHTLNGQFIRYTKLIQGRSHFLPLEQLEG